MSRNRVVVLRLVVRRRPVRVVLDTNLFVAAFWSPRSASAKVVDACEEGSFCLLASAAIRREMEHILRNARTSAPYRERVARILDRAEEVRPTHFLQVVPEDPDDDKFVECALDGDADYLVSSDAHLLRLGEIEGVRVLKPTAFAHEVLH